MKYFLLSLALFTLACQAQNTAPVELTSRLSAQKDIAKATDIVDNTFIIVGGNAPRAVVTREVKERTPIYHFAATGDANRIEFTTCFGSEENLKGISPEKQEVLKLIKDAYAYSDQGNYGDEITYEWSTRFPEKMEAGKGGIFAQWHGRPDRTLLRDPQGDMKHWTPEAFASLLDTMYFVKNIGHSKSTKKPNGWIVEQSAGGPVAAFHFKEDYMYLMVRSESNRMSDPTFKVKPKPGKHLNKVIGKNGKIGSVVFEMPSAQVPIQEWIDFKVTFKYSTYSQTEDKVLTPGYVKLWMNGVQVADWTGNVGKNDLHGPYFKFGIYKPKENGFKVDCKSYKQTINDLKEDQWL